MVQRTGPKLKISYISLINNSEWKKFGFTRRLGKVILWRLFGTQLPAYQSSVICHLWLSVSGNSKILHCGILINMPFCMSFLIYKPHPYCSLLTVTGASHVTTSNSFCGSRAWSEPCVNNMRGALESLKSRLKVYMTLHSYGQMWFVPYAWSRVAFPQDYQNLVSVEFSSIRLPV